jgi:hypothetical protein
MHSQKRAALAALFCLVSACVAPSPAGDAPVPRPAIQVGDRWIYSSRNHLTRAREPYEVRVTYAGGAVLQGLVTWQAEGAETESVWTAEWNNVVSAIETGGIVGRSAVLDPHAGLFRFPLQVGASWKSEYELTLPRRGDYRARHERTITVAGYEDVVVPAGEFRALKLVAEGAYRRVDGAVIPGTTRTVLWYVAEVRRWVKLTHEDVAGGQAVARRDDELVFFKLQ